MKLVSGLFNCHLRGVNSYVLRDRISDSVGMVRIFHNVDSCMSELVSGSGTALRPTLGEFNLAPHNHRQDITLYPLFGDVFNVDFEIDRLVHGKQQREWKFGSALLNDTDERKFQIEWQGTVDLRVSNVRLIRPCCSLRSDAVHTVVAPRESSAWLVVEGNPAPPKQKSLCYSLRGDFNPSSEGLYQPMDADALRAVERDERFAGVDVLLSEVLQ